MRTKKAVGVGLAMSLAAAACFTEPPRERVGQALQALFDQDYVDWPLNNNVCYQDPGTSPVPCPSGTVMTCTTECVVAKVAGESCSILSFVGCPQQDVCVDEHGDGRWVHSCVEVGTNEWECRKYDDGGNNLAIPTIPWTSAPPIRGASTCS